MSAPAPAPAPASTPTPAKLPSLCGKTEAQLFARPLPAGHPPRTDEDQCPFCIFKIGAHAQAVAGVDLAAAIASIETRIQQLSNKVAEISATHTKQMQAATVVFRPLITNETTYTIITQREFKMRDDVSRWQLFFNYLLQTSPLSATSFPDMLEADCIIFLYVPSLPLCIWRTPPNSPNTLQSASHHAQNCNAVLIGEHTTSSLSFQAKTPAWDNMEAKLQQLERLIVFVHEHYEIECHLCNQQAPQQGVVPAAASSSPSSSSSTGRPGSLDHFFVLLSSCHLPKDVSDARQMAAEGFRQRNLDKDYPHLAHLLSLKTAQFALGS